MHRALGYTAVMKDWMWILVVVAAIVVVAILLVTVVRRAARHRRSTRLRDRFGPEYETAVHRFGRMEGERHLEELLARHEERRIREASDEERDTAMRSLTAVQTSFVDSPVTAVRAADQLVFDVLRERGYPLESLDERASALAVDEPELAHRYREAHGTLARADATGDQDVAGLRDAFVSYRELLRDLVGAPSVGGRVVTEVIADMGDRPAPDRGTGTAPVPNDPEEEPWTSTRTDRT